MEATQRWGKVLSAGIVSKAMIIAALTFGILIVGCSNADGRSRSGKSGGGGSSGGVPETGTQDYRNSTSYNDDGTVKSRFPYDEGRVKKTIDINVGILPIKTN